MVMVVHVGGLGPWELYPLAMGGVGQQAKAAPMGRREGWETV